MDGVVALELFPDLVTRPLREYWAGPLWQPIPYTFRKCAWCKDHISVFGPPTADLDGDWAHKECVDKAERFALKSSIRHRTNPTTGHFPGWRTP